MIYSDDLERRIEALRNPTLYGGEPVTVHQTHISVVFVAGERAYKMKKPVDLGFVDYSTADKRREFCEAEVELNGRLAPSVYLGVRSVIETDNDLGYGEADDENAIDWVVEMVRLDESDNFLSHLHAGTLNAEWMRQLGRKMAAFHDRCERGEPGKYGSLETVAGNARDNFSQSSEQVGHTVHQHVFEAARAATDSELDALRELIVERDAAHQTRDTHGDLRLEHVYRVDGELAVVDCIEFNDAFRYADPIADIAFLVMDLRIRWAHDLADAFAEAYFDARPGGEELLDFYVGYRSAVRAKVHGIAASEPELAAATSERAFVKSRAHWLFTWSTLARPQERPALVIVGGLPGTGKTTLAHQLSETAGFVAIDSDEVRKELAGLGPQVSARSELDTGIYTAEWTDRTYAECLERATKLVFEGKRAVVSATFADNERREAFLRRAHGLGVAGVFMVCDLPESEALSRIAARKGAASDADDSVYHHVSVGWEAESPFVATRSCSVATTEVETARAQALSQLEAFGLV